MDSEDFEEKSTPNPATKAKFGPRNHTHPNKLTSNGKSVQCQINRKNATTIQTGYNLTRLRTDFSAGLVGNGGKILQIFGSENKSSIVNTEDIVEKEAEIYFSSKFLFKPLMISTQLWIQNMILERSPL